MLSNGVETAAVKAHRVMRAVVLDGFGGAARLRSTADAPVPQRVMSEVLVRVIAAGVNPIDVATRIGRGAADGLRGLPAVLGCDFSGIVEETPYQDSGLRVGDEVFGVTAFPRADGSYAEYAVAPITGIARKPAVLSHAEAAAVPTAACTAWGAVIDLVKAHEDQRILVLGAAGGVGHVAVQLGAHFGAHVIATSSASNAPWLRDLGAAETLDYGTDDFERVLAPVDAVIDLTGDRGERTCGRAMSVLRPNGLLVCVAGTDAPDLQQQAAAAGVRATTYRVAPQTPTLAVLARLITSGDLRVAVERVYPLEQVADAQRAVEAGGVRGKVVLQVADY